MKQKIQTTVFAFITIILVSAIIRFLNVSQFKDTQFAQFSPLAAMCLFTGSYFKNSWKAILFTLLTLFVSDMVIQQLVYNGKYGFIYGGWYWVYGVFVLITLLGKYVISKVTVTNVVIASVVGAIGHWLVMDLIVWIGGGSDARTNFTTPLTRDWAGLQQCYIQGIPFMRNLLVATVAYSSVMFGVYEFFTKKYEKNQFAVA